MPFLLFFYLLRLVVFFCTNGFFPPSFAAPTAITSVSPAAGDKRVYFLDMSTGKEVDMTSTAADLFMAPSTHCEGGEDAAILVEVGSGDEGQHLVSARVDGSAKKRLCPVSCAWSGYR